MMKLRNIATLCLLGAAFVLLGHDIIPHHHHYKNILGTYSCHENEHIIITDCIDFDSCSDDASSKQTTLNEEQSCDSCHFSTQRVYKPQKQLSLSIACFLFQYFSEKEDEDPIIYLTQSEIIPTTHYYYSSGLRAPPIS